MTHPELVEIARRWLCRKCSVVLTELVTTGETPDAIGWQEWCSTLIECNTSRADFMADADKYFRREPAMGMGLHRYYLTPPGLLNVSELPDKWGLLEAGERGVHVVRRSECFRELNNGREVALLLSALRRIGQQAPKGVSIKCYTHETQNTATLSFEHSAVAA